LHQILSNMPENIMGIKIINDVTSEDVDAVIMQLSNSANVQDNIRLMIEFEDFTGWPVDTHHKMAGFMLNHRDPIKRIALVGRKDDPSVLERMLSMVPGLMMERFADKKTAQAWLMEDDNYWTVDPTRYEGTVRQPKDMRILIVGAGVAGLTLASMLQQRDMSPVVVEDAPEFGSIGYVIILMSAGSRVLKGLGGYEAVQEHGVQVQSYDIATTDGEILRQHGVADWYAPLFGNSYSIYRPTLVDVIKNTMKDQSVIRMGTTVDTIEQTNEEVNVTFSDGTEDTFDLVVGADGLHSRMRELVFGDVEMSYSGLRGWAWWGEKNDDFDNRALEYWGNGGAFGLYPTEDRLCIVGVIRADEDEDDSAEHRKSLIRKHFKGWGGKVDYGLDQLDDMDAKDIFHDAFYYGNQPHWYHGRVVLAGDAVHPFSPISGMGASMAMESAAVLAEELCYVDSQFIDQALRKYQERRKFRVTTLQEQARRFEDVVTSGNSIVESLRYFSVGHIDNGPVHHFLARIPYQPV